MTKNKTREQVLQYQLWKKGNLSWKLQPQQKVMYADIWKSINLQKSQRYTLNCSRRFGKTTTLCLIALEFAIKNPNSQIRYATYTNRAAKSIVLPIMRQLLNGCPKDIKPAYKTQDLKYVFPNGSEIILSGTDKGNADNLRGTASHLNIVDEAAFVDDLEYVLSSILEPQTITTRGTSILASTPPSTPGHDFYQIAQDCEAKNLYSKYTIFDNSSLTQDIIDDLIESFPKGIEDTTFKREYLCEFVTDQDSQVIPEWDDCYIQEIERNSLFPYYSRYVGMDLGVRDNTAGIFAYYDFVQAKVFIEDEFTLSGNSMTTKLIHSTVSSIEKKLWGDASVRMRISDNNNPLLLQDLGIEHDMHFIPTTKETLEAMINQLRVMVNAGKIIVSPKCKNLIGCLKYAIYENNSTGKVKIARSTTWGHYDHLMALIYMIRHIDYYSNPLPSNMGISIVDYHIEKEQYETNKSYQQLSKMFLPKRPRN